MGYNSKYHVVISGDEKGMLEYWSTQENGEIADVRESSAVKFRFKVGGAGCKHASLPLYHSPFSGACVR